MHWMNIILNHPIISLDPTLRMFIDVINGDCFSMLPVAYGSTDLRMIMEDDHPLDLSTTLSDELMPEWDVWNELEVWVELMKHKINIQCKLTESLSKNYQAMAADICGLTLQLSEFRDDQLGLEKTETLARNIYVRSVPNLKFGCKLDMLNEVCRSLSLIINGMDSMLKRQKKILIEEHQEIHAMHLRIEVDRPHSQEERNKVRLYRGAWIKKKRFGEEQIISEKAYVREIIDNGLYLIISETDSLYRDRMPYD